MIPDRPGTASAGPAPTTRRFDPVVVIALLIGAGVVLRLFVAGFYLPLSGYATDVGNFTIWANRLASAGPGRFYELGGLTDYPPGYMYVLWLLGSVGKMLQPVTFGIDVTRGLIKIPGILADGGVAWLLFAYCRRHGREWLGGMDGARLGLVAAAIYLFNPGIIFDSAVWGQVDAVGTLVVVATLLLLARGWTEAASAGAVLAMLVKFQFGFLIPVVAIVGLKRHLFGRSSDPVHDDRRDPMRVLTSLAAGLGSLVALLLPFNMAVWAPGNAAHSLIDKFTAATNTYSGLSVNGFSIWRNPWSGLGDTLWRGCDIPDASSCPSPAGVAFQIGDLVVNWQMVGAGMFAVVAIFALWQIARRDDPLGLLIGSLTLAVAFFALPTRVHERYLFPALALAAPLVMRAGRWAILFGVLSVLFFANVYWVYTADWSFVSYVVNPGIGGLPMPRDPFLAAFVFNDAGIYLLSASVAIALGWIAWQGIRLPSRRAAYFALSAPIPSTIPTQSLSAAPGIPPRSRWALPNWMRRDPYDPYRREPPRRLDRIDLLLVVGLVLVSLLFRFWRLELPRSMHFDEQYHARSATEWMADWQEGWTRDVYEWTHPMLAKYLIAAGITFADPNRVVETMPLDAPAAALAVAPRRAAQGRLGSVVFAAARGSSEVVARDAIGGAVLARWMAPGEIASLAWSEGQGRLYVGLAQDGRVAVYDTSLFLTVSGPRSPPPPLATITTDLANILQIVVPANEPILVLLGSDGVVTVEPDTGTTIATSPATLAGVAYLGGNGGDSGQPALVLGTDPQVGGVLLLDAGTLQPDTDIAGSDGFISLPGPPVGPILVRGTGNDRQVWVPVGALPADLEHGPVDGGIAVFDQGMQLIDTAPLPGTPSQIGWNAVVNMIYVTGTEHQNGRPAVWTVQPWGSGGTQSSGFAAFDTTYLDGATGAIGFDMADTSEADDHERLVVATEHGTAGSLVAIDVGSNAFAWRLAGIVFGSILVGLIYLLAATLFPRRRIAVLAGLFVAFDGMSYVMSRIAMNDIFAATFIVAAYLVFWQVWSGRWARSAWWAMPLVGVLIGLAASTKWVGFYALAGIWVLFLGRSNLGRFLLVAAIGFLTVVAGLGAPWPFTLVCLAALALAVLLVARRPVQLEPSDVWAMAPMAVVGGGIGLAFAIAYAQVDGRSPRSAVELVFAVLARGAQAAWPAWLMLGVAAALIIMRSVLSLVRPASDRRWYLPAEMGGLSWPWFAACLGVIPLLVYFIVYIPYLQLGHGIATQGLGPGYAWSLDELQSQMFGYHFGLTAGHPASSPWWSWPLDLKPVWFYSHSFDDRQLAVIYNGGNPILFWAGVPAIFFAAVQAWRRRSFALVLVVAAFAFQYLPWTRIERATFHYHYLAAALFAMIAVAYAVDEGLRSWRNRSLAIAFLVAVAVAGVLIFPLGSALAMPDWYINAARALAPWNYAFQFPAPSTDARGQLVSADTLKLAAGTLVSLAVAAYALFGRDMLPRRREPRSSEATAGGDQGQNSAEVQETERPEASEGDGPLGML